VALFASGLTEDYRPFSFAEASGKVEGIDVDMAMNLAQSLGVRLEIVKTSWSTLRSDLETNSFRRRHACHLMTKWPRESRRSEQSS
jgi:ABC-type amino acid transport substrate-binding protein